jgi:thymidylate kinase
MPTSVEIPISSATGDFIRTLFAVFERTGVRYCVLHGWEELPWTVSSDLDLVIHPEDFSKLAVVFGELTGAGYKWIQCRYYAGCSYRFDFAWFEGQKFHVVGVDCIFEYRYAGLILRSGEDLLKDRRQHNGFWIASTENVLAYLLMKKSLKAEISEAQLRELHQLSAEIGAVRSQAIAEELFGSETGARIVAALADHSLPAMLPKLREHLSHTLLSKNPWSFVRYRIEDKLRLIKRWFQPTGLFLVVLGPDGVGKSTVLAPVAENLREAFRSVHFFHYRAIFGERSNAIVANPHGKTPRGPVLSTVRVLLLVLQFWASYLVIVRPKLGRSGLIVFDRYFHDLLVDQRRYRYAGPQWLLRVLLKIVPQPDFMLVLDADESVILSRKQEVSPEQLRILRNRYNSLAASNSDAALVGTGKDVGSATVAATQAVYEYLLRRAGERYPEWTTGYVGSEDGGKVVPFPKAG